MTLPATQDVLILAPHPDDEAFGCGGTIRLMTHSGRQADVLYLTRGEQGGEPGSRPSGSDRQQIAARRSEEAFEACRLLGIRNVSFLEGHDGHLTVHPELAERILAILRRGEYRSVFCPWPHDGHADHAATYDMLHAALQYYERELDVWLYEVWTPLPPNMLIPIDSAIEAKIEAMRAHRSQIAVADYATAFRALAQYRSLLCPSSQFAEAFFTCEAQTLLDESSLPWIPRHQSASRLQYA